MHRTVGCQSPGQGLPDIGHNYAAAGQFKLTMRIVRLIDGLINNDSGRRGRIQNRLPTVKYTLTGSPMK